MGAWDMRTVKCTDGSSEAASGQQMQVVDEIDRVLSAAWMDDQRRRSRLDDLMLQYESLACTPFAHLGLSG